MTTHTGDPPSLNTIRRYGARRVSAFIIERGHSTPEWMSEHKDLIFDEVSILNSAHPISVKIAVLEFEYTAASTILFYPYDGERGCVYGEFASYGVLKRGRLHWEFHSPVPNDIGVYVERKSQGMRYVALCKASIIGRIVGRPWLALMSWGPAKYFAGAVDDDSAKLVLMSLKHGRTLLSVNDDQLRTEPFVLPE